MLIITVAISSNEYAKVLCSSLLESTVATSLSLMDRKYNLYLVYKKNTICI
jgi:hypothetical protein